MQPATVYASVVDLDCRSVISRTRLALYLDGLSVTMLGVITGVGFFIHMFASWYMRGEKATRVSSPT